MKMKKNECKTTMKETPVVVKKKKINKIKLKLKIFKFFLNILFIEVE